MQRITLALVALLAVAGCSSAPDPTPAPSVTVSAPTEAPADGVLLSDLGFLNAPPGFSIPRGADIEQEVDSTNNVTVVLTAPAGDEVAAYLRRNLPAMGFKITADANGSMLFESAVHDGAFTVTGDLSALSLRTDRSS
ncbi:lipoprotein [Tessaracoccus sp. G1721]